MSPRNSFDFFFFFSNKLVLPQELTTWRRKRIGRNKFFVSILDNDRFHITILNFVHDFDISLTIWHATRNKNFLRGGLFFTLLTVNAPIYIETKISLATSEYRNVITVCLVCVASRRDSYYQLGKNVLESCTRTNCRADQQNTIVTW